MAEHLALLYQQGFGIQTKIARSFAFLGPYLPLDAHFAAGNFLNDGLDGRSIRVNGDGTPYRSYLYAADLAIWLWTILFRGELGRAYNVGCEREVTVAELACMIAGYFATGTQFCTAPRPDAKAARYVPSTRRAREELGLETWISLEEAVDRTARWHFLRRMEGKSPGALQAAGSLAGGE
jgi:dTDP-glucose 4,6-dehydratase